MEIKAKCTYWDRRTHDQWQRFSSETLTTGQVIEYYCKPGGITGEIMIIEY